MYHVQHSGAKFSESLKLIQKKKEEDEEILQGNLEKKCKKDEKESRIATIRRQIREIEGFINLTKQRKLSLKEDLGNKLSIFGTLAGNPVKLQVCKKNPPDMISYL